MPSAFHNEQSLMCGLDVLTKKKGFSVTLGSNSMAVISLNEPHWEKRFQGLSNPKSEWTYPNWEDNQTLFDTACCLIYTR